jgi:hypothetical protein
MWALGSRYTLVVLEQPRGEALGLNFLAIAALGILLIDRVASHTAGMRSRRGQSQIETIAPR